MRFEFYFRRYNTFGSNATLDLLNKWCYAELAESYGCRIQCVVVEGWCKNTSPPKATLEQLHASFEMSLRNLPLFELQEDGAELRLCFRALRYSHDEISRDVNVLALFTFKSFLSKTAQLLENELAREKTALPIELERLARDLRLLRERAPRTLSELVQFYVEQQRAA